MQASAQPAADGAACCRRMDLAALPDGVLVAIAGQLEAADLQAACQASRAWTAALSGLLTALQPSQFSARFAVRLAGPAQPGPPAAQALRSAPPAWRASAACSACSTWT